MDQVKIGKFIATKRKEQNLTQAQVAEKLGITDRAVSKWETGRSLPDASVMLELCGMLKITVNELLSGEELSVNDYNEKMEQNLLEMVKQKEQADKRLLTIEMVIGFISLASFLVMLSAGAWLLENQTGVLVPALLIGIGIAQFLVAMLFALRIEQVAGYYECRKCGHRYVPTYGSVNLAMHLGRTRYMKCPKCQKRSWQKKVISKE